MEKENRKEFLKFIASLVAIIVFAAAVVSVIPYAENKYYGWKITNNVVGIAGHKLVFVVQPGPEIQADRPVNITIGGKEIEDNNFIGARIISLPIGEHILFINGDKLKVVVASTEEEAKEMPGFETLAVFIAFTIIFVKLRRNRTGG